MVRRGHKRGRVILIKESGARPNLGPRPLEFHLQFAPARVPIVRLHNVGDHVVGAGIVNSFIQAIRKMVTFNADPSAGGIGEIAEGLIVREVRDRSPGSVHRRD